MSPGRSSGCSRPATRTAGRTRTTAAPSSSSSPPQAGQQPTDPKAGTSGMQAALAHWPPQELHQLATLLHRMVDDFLAYAAAEEREQPAR